MHVQIEVVVINLPKDRCALISNRAEVMLPIWVIVRCEGVKQLYLSQYRIYIPSEPAHLAVMITRHSLKVCRA